MTENKDTAQNDLAGIPAEITSILTAIEKEPVPDRLLKLALELQGALTKRRLAEQAAQTVAHANPPEGI